MSDFLMKVLSQKILQWEHFALVTKSALFHSISVMDDYFRIFIIPREDNNQSNQGSNVLTTKITEK